MISILKKVVDWICSKTVLYLVILLLCIAGYMLTKLPGLLSRQAEQRVEKARNAWDEGRKIQGDLAREFHSVGDQIRTEAERAKNLRKEIEDLKSMFNRTWDWWANWGEDWKKYKAQIKQKEDEARQSDAKLQEHRKIQNDITAKWRREQQEDPKREQEVQRYEEALAQHRQTEEGFRKVFAGGLGRMARKAAWIFGLLLLLPVLWKVIMFWGWARLAERAAPIVLENATGQNTSPVFQPSSPALCLELLPGEELLAKERFLQSSTEDVEKSTQWLLDRRYPFTSLASGLFMVTRLRHRTPGAQDNCSVTLSCQDNATEEVALIELPAGGRLAFRPHFLAGLIYPAGSPPCIRSHWVFSRLQAWLTFQFRYLVIEGPVKLVFTAQRGVQLERVQSSVAGRRINCDLTVAFAPALHYSPRRAETFLAYFRGANPLFDDFFKGDGWILNQQVGGIEGPAETARKFWDRFFGAIGKVFGL